MCSSLLQLALRSRDQTQSENTKTVQQIHKMTLKIVLDEQNLRENSCHFVNLLSFTQQLFSSQLEINHVILSQQKKTRWHVNHHRMEVSLQLRKMYFKSWLICTSYLKLSWNGENLMPLSPKSYILWVELQNYIKVRTIFFVFCIFRYLGKWKRE